MGRMRRCASSRVSIRPCGAGCSVSPRVMLQPARCLRATAAERRCSNPLAPVDRSAGARAWTRCEFDALGTLYVFRDPRGFEHHCARRWRCWPNAESPPRAMDGAATLAYEPAPETGCHGSVLFRRRPAQARIFVIAELARLVRESGSTIAEARRIDGLVRDGGRIASVATADAGGVQARDIVYALGAWSPASAKPLGVRIRSSPARATRSPYTRPGAVTHSSEPGRGAECLRDRTGFRLSSRRHDGVRRSFHDLRISGARASTHAAQNRQFLHERRRAWSKNWF